MNKKLLNIKPYAGIEPARVSAINCPLNPNTRLDRSPYPYMVCANLAPKKTLKKSALFIFAGAIRSILTC